MVLILSKQKIAIEINKQTKNKKMVSFMAGEEKSIIIIETNEFIKLCKF